MASKKKSDENATERVVEVAVPAVKGVALNDIYRAALTSVRDEIPLVSNLSYEVVDSDKKGDERTYQVKISWGPREALPSDSDPEDGDFVRQQIDALAVPTALPASTESDPTA